ncbi:ABC transporter permease [Cryptosporangium arvum]|jgi:ABC-2 type transport system permease protein|uniref:ABC transporter permease n=1 Tax=Cryptosporangium arvum TaxID=80871 RepID=UPI00055C8383|nr:ABC transporter permease [Cryptosporangium arvum]
MTYALSDSATMFQRNIKHLLRNPTAIMVSVLIPVFLLLLFVGVFRALGQAAAGDGEYIDYLVPGILLMTIAYGVQSTTLAVNQDMTEGVIQRFRTMAIAPSSVLTGHVLAALVRTLVSIALVLGVSLALGFRPDAGPLDWLAVLGLVTLMSLALAWLSVAVGLAAPTVDSTGGFLIIIQLLPFISSAFVPTDTMSGAIRWFAENQPFTVLIDAIRALFSGAAVGSDGWVAVAWCVALTLVGYGWSRAAFRKIRVR